MWNRKELKRSAKKAVRANYWQCVIVSLIMLALVSSTGFASLGNMKGDMPIAEGQSTLTRTDIAVETLEAMDTVMPGGVFLMGMVSEATGATQGVLATIFNNSTSSGSFFFGVLNGVNQLVLQNRILPGVIILLGAVLGFVYWLLFENMLLVGERRFYLENRLYSQSKAGRLFYLFKIRRVRHTASILFFRELYLVLWSLTIVGVFVKAYSYRMIPFIVAENPGISRKEAFRLSREMMRGNKWRAFMLDVSFFGWGLLSVVTLGLLEVFWLSPYRNAAFAELYITLRAEQLSRGTALSPQLNDPWLTTRLGEDAVEYPVAQYTIPEHAGRRWISPQYKRRYAFLDYVMLFYAFSMVGYIHEVLYFLFGTGTLINRGTMYGPWLPVYGCGGVLTLFLLHRWAEKPLRTFFASMALCGVLEYATAWCLETFFHTKWWDYTGFFLNIQGRVCLEGLILFGLACSLGIYFLSPTLAGCFDKIPKKGRKIICIVISILFATDLVISAIHPNMAAGVPV